MTNRWQAWVIILRIQEGRELKLWHHFSQASATTARRMPDVLRHRRPLSSWWHSCNHAAENAKRDPSPKSQIPLLQMKSSSQTLSRKLSRKCSDGADLCWWVSPAGLLFQNVWSQLFPECALIGLAASVSRSGAGGSRSHQTKQPEIPGWAGRWRKSSASSSGGRETQSFPTFKSWRKKYWKKKSEEKKATQLFTGPLILISKQITL